MLHNSGPYGPPDTPVNMGAPLNMSQLNGLNLVNNLGKISQDAPHAAAEHYTHTSYPHYGSSTLNMSSQINQFANYHNPGVHSNFSIQNSPLIENSPWHSGMLSMNLNLQHEHNTNMLNFHQNYDKKSHGMHESCHNGLPLNVPQLHSKDYFRHSMNYDNSHYNVSSKPTENNLSVKNTERSQLDNTRRRSLENTVKLIENILLNTTAKSREQADPPAPAPAMDFPKQDKPIQPIPTIEPQKQQDDDLNEIIDMTERNMKSFYDKDTRDSSQDTYQSTQDSQYKVEESQESTSNMSKDTELKESMSEEGSTEDEFDRTVEIKEEQPSWTITDYSNPFAKDQHAVQRDDVGGVVIADAETSVKDATEALKNGSKHEYYECPHCNLLLRHPKRFLIHAKWHTFGINKKAELARQRELRKKEKGEKDKSVPEEFSCKDCDKIFNTKTSLKNHRHRTHSSRALERRPARPRPAPAVPYQCSECPKRFKYKHSLDKHRDTHLEKTHACAECPKKFGSPTLLKMHMKSHERASRGPTLSCSYCGKGYYESYTLQVHERTHRNERPFSCEICNSTFGCNSSLRRHMRVSHSTSKPHECAVCHRNFATESIRDRHQLRAHSNPEDFKFICKQCPSRYFKLKDLQRHICKVHPKGKSRSRTKEEDD
ncbi:zinc finger protein 582 [Manduca sexta]|uniref:C2H2-type domain-containing protein n=1 Tax=Manduca sexta TaxID=7130 RepID=A0A921ZD93_MANSE|nr:zinc finger protein 582 [Manduca sexta]KAG6454667.1 hypothetical protein O3G_MSEX008818 [Manduca sexta]